MFTSETSLVEIGSSVSVSTPLHASKYPKISGNSLGPLFCCNPAWKSNRCIIPFWTARLIRFQNQLDAQNSHNTTNLFFSWPLDQPKG
ncbi:hypothetical protein CSKR_102773 [Clonorchis sinensis]|uniref:Uncharacterized protein n=2 Tax=Clonorchis sinensis TaxID=79923 RepID=G7Y3F7_CLOSI|nr:hypothetical protein CSKR_102773 [Clonorchis sinensis]GAA47494.1 hypothetical protein CLF_100433 [Clonorchis sinensis]